MKTNSQKHKADKTGILLINLGTPDATDLKSVRRYLKQFMSDKRVIDARGPVWWLILNLIILRRRPHSLSRAYKAIWNHELDESPLRSFTRAQAQKLGEVFADAPKNCVDWAMRYGTPSIEEGIQRLTDQGCDQLVLFPLYPQYGGATTGTALDAAFAQLQKLNVQPALRTIAPYFDHPAYIDALATSIGAHHKTLNWTPEVTLASLHGLPVDHIAKGDPYQAQCEASMRALRQALDMSEKEMPLCYQSRTGRKEWTGPDTEETLINLAQSGVKNLSVVTPGFASDCIETLEEIGLRARDAFLSAGGENFTLVPCLNDSDAAISMLKQLVDENAFPARR